MRNFHFFLLIFLYCTLILQANADATKEPQSKGALFGIEILPQSVFDGFNTLKSIFEERILALLNDYELTKYTNKPVQPEDSSSGVDQGIVAIFENQSPFRVSLNWDNNEDLIRVVNIILPGESTQVNTFVDHVFQFTREGTKDMIHEPFTIRVDQEKYILPADSKIDDNPCRDRLPTKCKVWAKEGECTNNPGWMIVNCPVACDSCELLDPYKRCDPNFLNISEDSFWKPGDVNKMFEDILANENMVKELGVSVVTRPPEQAWLLQFDNFLSAEEAEVLIEWGKVLGYQRSTDSGTLNERGEATQVFSTGRTSSNAWCTGGCESDPVVQRVSQRIVNITKVPYENYEQFQMLQYQLGQKYNVHHDMSPKDDARAGGVRILTFFLYLSDVEEGGETDFPRMGVKVKPKQGRAVLWPSTLDEDPMKQDPRTYHAALPVIKGTKYAANHWIHSHNFKKANKWGCTGAFS